jgi:hypothetical protein
MTVAFSRRRFLNALGTSAGAVVVAPWLDGPIWRVGPIETASLSIGDLKTLVDAALDRARALGCSFAGLLIERRLDAAVSMRAIAAEANSSVTIRGEQTCYVSTYGKCMHMSRVWEA